MKLSVIIPCYNEEKGLPKNLKEIDQYLSKQPYEYEILVVNDGSKDRTFEVTKSLEPEIKGLKIVGHKASPEYTENRGKGYAVRFGMLKAQGDYRLFTDADNSTSIDQVEKMWPEFEAGYDIVIGSRDVKGAVLDPPQPWRRVMLGNILNLIIQVVLGLWGIWDTQCGFKGFTKKATEDIFPKGKIDRWIFDPELLIIGKRMGYKIKEIPVHWVNRKDSRVKLVGPNSMVAMLQEIAQIKWNLLTKKYGKTTEEPKNQRT